MRIINREVKFLLFLILIILANIYLRVVHFKDAYLSLYLFFLLILVITSKFFKNLNLLLSIFLVILSFIFVAFEKGHASDILALGFFMFLIHLLVELFTSFFKTKSTTTILRR